MAIINSYSRISTSSIDSDDLLIITQNGDSTEETLTISIGQISDYVINSGAAGSAENLDFISALKQDMSFDGGVLTIKGYYNSSETSNLVQNKADTSTVQDIDDRLRTNENLSNSNKSDLSSHVTKYNSFKQGVDSDVNQLYSTTATNTGKIDSNYSAINANTQNISNLSSALGLEYVTNSNLDSTLQSYSTTVATTQLINSTMSTAGYAEQSSLDTLQATVNNNSSSISDNSTAITDESSARASAITSLNSTVNGHTASITTHQSTIADIDGKLDATYSLKVTSDKNVAGMKLGANDETSYVSFLADNFKIYNGNTPFSPFIVENGQVKIKSAAIGNLTLGNFSDIPDELKQITAVYADDINGTNASTTKGSKNFVAWYNGTSIWTPSMGVGNLEFSQITGSQGAQGPQGGIGPAGTSITVKGSVNTVNQLPSSNNTKGDSYTINGTLWVFDGTNWIETEDLRGTSQIQKPASSSHPSSPKNGWNYYNTTDKKSYRYQDGVWYQTSNDGATGQDGSSVEWKGSYPNSNIPSSPEKGWAYYNTDHKKSYVYNGSAWSIMTNDGSDGTDGNGVFITYHSNPTTSTPTKPANSSDGTTGGWTTVASASANWMSQKVSLTATTGEWGSPILIAGANGTSINVKDNLDNVSDLPSTGQTLGDTYLISGDMWVYTSASSNNGFTNAGSVQGPQGDKGDAGLNGDHAYIHWAYADNVSGGNFHTSDPTDRDFIGVYTSNVQADSNNPADYTWSKIKGEKGDKGDPGETGPSGTSVIHKGEYANRTVFLNSPGIGTLQNGWTYYDQELKKSFTYQDNTWYTQSVDGIDGTHGDGFSYKGEFSTPPSNPSVGDCYRDTDNNKVYVWADTNGGTWQILTQDGNDGAQGLKGDNGYSVFITYHNNDVDNSPTKPATGTNGTEGGWNTDSNSNPNWMSQKVSSTATSGEWGSPILMTGQKGEKGDKPTKGQDYLDGKNGNFVSFIYRVSDSQPPTPTGGSFDGASEITPTNWTDSPTVSTQDVEWVSTTRYSHQVQDDTWSNSGWSAPVKFYQRGQQGVAGPAGYSPKLGQDYNDGVDGNNVRVEYSVNGTSGWTTSQQAGVVYRYIRTSVDNNNNGIYIPGPASKFVPEKGVEYNDGVDGSSSYVHIKYSNDGVNFTAQYGEVVGDWIGTYADSNQNDSTTFSDYTWKKIVGQDGANGLKTKTGLVWYSAGSSSNPGQPEALGYDFSSNTITGLTSGWGLTPPMMQNGTSSNIYWSCTYDVIEDSPNTGQISFGTTTQSFGFDQAVTFNQLKTNSSTIIHGSNITTGVIKSSNYIGPSYGNSSQGYSTFGMGIDMNDGSIHAEQFYVNANGGAGFKGSINLTSPATSTRGAQSVTMQPNQGKITVEHEYLEVGYDRFEAGKSELSSQGLYINNGGLQIQDISGDPDTPTKNSRSGVASCQVDGSQFQMESTNNEPGENFITGIFATAYNTADHSINRDTSLKRTEALGAVIENLRADGLVERLHNIPQNASSTYQLPDLYAHYISDSSSSSTLILPQSPKTGQVVKITRIGSSAPLVKSTHIDGSGSGGSNKIRSITSFASSITVSKTEQFIFQGFFWVRVNHD